MSGVAPQEESESDSSFSNESGAEGFHFPSSAESAKLRKDSGAVGIVERHHDKHDKMGALLGLSPGSVRRERNMVSAQRGEKLTSVAELYISALRERKIVPSGLSLEQILSEREHLQMFKLFAEKSLCEEPIEFYIRVCDFNAAPKFVAGSIALNILNNYIVDGAQKQLGGLPGKLVERTKYLILENDPAPFDGCMRFAMQAMAAQLPNYVSFLEKVAGQMPQNNVEVSPRRKFGNLLNLSASLVAEESTSTSTSDSPSENGPPVRSRETKQILSLEELITPRNDGMSLITPRNEGSMPQRQSVLLARRSTKSGNLLGLTPKMLRAEEMLKRRQSSDRLKEEIAAYKNNLPLRSTSSGRVTAADMPLDQILETPTLRKTFLLFAEAALSQGAVLFYFRINEFKALVGESQNVIDSTALNIWTNFMSSKAEHQVIISSAASSRTRERILSGQITVNLYDECQREAYSVMAFSIYPQYLVFLNNNTPQRRMSKNPTPSPRAELDKLLQSDENLLRRLESELKLNVEDDEDTSTDSSISFSGVRRGAVFSGMQDDDDDATSIDNVDTSFPMAKLDTPSPKAEGGNNNNDPPDVSPIKTELPQENFVTPTKPAMPQVESLSRSSGTRPETLSRGSVGSRSSFKAPAFKAVMEDKILMSSFRAYCESVHKTEFLEFLEKIALFKQEAAGSVFSRGFVVWSEYLSGTSPTPVIVGEENSGILDKLKARIQSDSVSANLFDEAESFVLDHLEKVIFPDYNRFVLRHNETTIKTAAIRRSMSSTGIRSPSLARKDASSPGMSRKDASSPAVSRKESESVVAEASSESEAKASDSDENGGVFVIPSLREVLLVNSPHFLQFLEFAKKCMCSEALLFWKMVADFEAERDVDKMQQIAQLIYESFISSSFDTQLNLSSVSKKEIIFDVQNGLIRSDMFDNAKKEVQLLLAHDLFPRFVLHLSARVRERAALAAVVPKVVLPRPQVQELWNCLRKGVSSSSLQSSVFKNTSESFETHDFMSRPNTVLRLIVCSAFMTNQRGGLQKIAAKTELDEDVVAEMRVSHVDDDSFSVELFNLRKKRLIEHKDLTDTEVLSLLKLFSELRESDFVVKYSGDDGKIL